MRLLCGQMVESISIVQEESKSGAGAAMTCFHTPLSCGTKLYFWGLGPAQKQCLGSCS